MSIPKCDHGSYIPQGELVAIYCPLCNPDGVPDGPVPVLPRSSGDPLNATRAGERKTCTCGNLRTYAFDNCRVCGLPYEDASRSRDQFAANDRQPGACPECSSTVHYEGKKKSEWECADCGTVYPAPKRIK